jgi:hypothetical protein
MYIIIFIAFFSSCNQVEKKKDNSNLTPVQQVVQQVTITDSCNSYDSLLSEYAETFKALTVNLEESISAELRNFINTVDTNCLRKQKQYKYFVATILAKLYAYHIEYGEVGYDLLAMKTGAAKIIIKEFQILAGYNKRLEFLNSGNIVSFIKQDPELRTNKTLQKLISQFKWE